MGEINIRKINVSDYEDIYVLNQQLGYEYPLEKLKRRITFIMGSTKDIILVAEKDEKVIGYIHGSPYELLYSDSLINILGFVVNEKCRKNGVGKLLINSLENLVREKGYSGVRLVSGYNRVDAHRFYEMQGYINRKDQKNFIKLFN